MNPGDMVQFNRIFLRSIGAGKEIADIRGKVLKVEPLPLSGNYIVTIDGPDRVFRSLASNLEVIK